MAKPLKSCDAGIIIAGLMAEVMAAYRRVYD